MTSLARAERERLLDLAVEVGPDAPTLCGDWTVKELVAHLWVREHSVSAAGIVVPGLGGAADRAVARTARKRSFRSLVDRVRGRWSPLRLPGIDQALNTIEFFVHHEDIRRAQHAWEPRPLPLEDQDALWRAIKVSGRGLVRPAGVATDILRTETGERATLRSGQDPVVISGPPAEIVLFLYGRRQTRGLEFSGPDEQVDRLKSARLGI